MESVLLYGSKTWTMSQSPVKRVNGCYGWMLRMAHHINWQQKLSNADVFGRIPMQSVMIVNRHMGVAGLIARHNDLLAKELLFLGPTAWIEGPGKPTTHSSTC